tara:strand:- start:487 stop:1167 length:681 start_codon:yes stop_codon:yes gene_type:complete
MKKVISFSLWGDDPKYTIGAIKNAELAKTVYPGWVPRFYCAKNSVPENIINRLKELNSEIIFKDSKGDWTSTVWRFEAIADLDVDIMISRDTDSRLSYREKLAVDKWLESDKMFHIMRDHPAHAIEILAGMWGVKSPMLRNINSLIGQYRKEKFKQFDQTFLRKIIYPMVKNYSYVNDEFFEKKPFPEKRSGLEFVGQVYDQNNIPTKLFEEDLRKFLEKAQNYKK